MHHQFGADLGSNLRLLIGVRGLFKHLEQLLDMSMVRLQQFRRVRVGSRTRTVFRILCVSRIALWIRRAWASGAFSRLPGSSALPSPRLDLCHSWCLRYWIWIKVLLVERGRMLR